MGRRWAPDPLGGALQPRLAIVMISGLVSVSGALSRSPDRGSAVIPATDRNDRSKNAAVSAAVVAAVRIRLNTALPNKAPGGVASANELGCRKGRSRGPAAERNVR